MNRIAVIINSDGSKSKTEQTLPQLAHDVSGLSSFFISANGGAWTDEEIVVLDPNSKQELINKLSLLRADYFIFVFTGHGYMQNYETRFCLPDGYFTQNDIITATQAKRSLFIADSCRRIERAASGTKLVESRMFSSYREPSYIKACRALYDNCLSQIPDGAHFTAYSCQPDQFSSATDDGSRYIQALLNVAKGFAEKESRIEEVHSFGEVHTIAREIVARQTGNKQVPSYECIKCAQPPFVISHSTINEWLQGISTDSQQLNHN